MSNKLALLKKPNSNRTAQSVQAWIAECRGDNRGTESEPRMCVGFILMHKGTDRELDNFQLGGSPGRSDEEITNRLLGRAASYSESLAGVQTFEILAFYQGSQEPLAYKPFQMGGRTEHDGLATESPDVKGVLAQGMRLAELTVQQAALKDREMSGLMMQMLHEVRNENRDLRTENRALFDTTKNLLVEMSKMQFDTETKRAEVEQARKDREMWLRMAPPLINNLLGREIFPQSTTDTHLIELAAENITEDQMMMLSQVLPPTLWGPLAARFKQFHEKKLEEQKRAAQIAETVSPILPNSEEGGLQ